MKNSSSRMLWVTLERWRASYDWCKDVVAALCGMNKENE